MILHEHAHVQRRDDWSRLAQTLLLSVLWIHPAALFVSRALNREREMACDEWVVARTGLPKAYARCLARAAEVRGRMRGGPTLVPALFGSRHDLVRRVDRLLAVKGQARRNVSLAGAIAAACAMVVMSVQLQSVLRFAEIAEIVFPSVAQPMQRPCYDEVQSRCERCRRRARPVQRVQPSATAHACTTYDDVPRRTHACAHRT